MTAREQRIRRNLADALHAALAEGLIGRGTTVAEALDRIQPNPMRRLTTDTLYAASLVTDGTAS